MNKSRFTLALLLLTLLCASLNLRPAYAANKQPAEQPISPNAVVERALLPIAVYSHSVVADGTYVYSVGGIIDGLTKSDALQRYNPTSNTWQQMTPMPLPVYATSACAMQGKIYVAGGVHDYPNGRDLQRTIYIYSIAANNWTTSTLYIGGGFASSAAVCHAASNTIYVIGGSTFSVALNTVRRYDVANNVWLSDAPRLPQPRSYGAAGLISGDRIIFSNGCNSCYSGLNTTWTYTIGSNAWVQVRGSNYSSYGMAGRVGPDGYFYLAGGTVPINGNEGASDHIERYDPATDRWETMNDRLVYAADFTAGAWNAGKFYVVSGNYPRGRNQEYTIGAVATVTPGPTQTSIPSATVTGTRSATPIVTPSSTPGPATNTPPPTATTVPPTATSIPPTSTPVPSTQTPGGATATPAPPTATNVPPTATSVPPTSTPEPTQTPGGPTATAQPSPTTCNISFSDVLTSNIFYGDIQFLACRSIVNGANGLFRPNDSTKRGEFAKIATLGFAIPAFTPTTPTFSDVAPGSIFYGFIEAAAHAGVVNGLSASQCAGLGSPGTCYGPNVLISRAQVALIVQRAKGYTVTTVTGPTFSDVPTTNFAFTAIETLARKGIINGAACVAPQVGQCFRPNDNIRRGELSKVVRRAIEATAP